MVGRAIKARGQVTLTKLYDGTNGTDGKNGSDGAVGAPGEDGKTTYVHVAYSSSADGKTNFSITDPSGRSYIGVLTDFTEKDSTDYTQYSWSLVKGQDGQNGEDGAPGAPGEDGKTTYIHIAYANSADGQTDFSTTENSGKKYIGVLTDEVEKDSTDYTQYSWSLFKGQDGQNGEDGAPGAPGEDGKTTYIHIAYANSADGQTDFSTSDNSGKKYIGVLTDEVEKDSTDYTQYSWSLFKGQDGEDGADGTPGKPGADGKTPYVHFAYANSADGNTDFSTTVYSNKKYIGTLTDYTIPDSTDYTKYTWTLIKGADGADGTPGKPGADGRTPYVHFAYANSADGNTDFSTTVYANKKFIGTLTDYTVADSTDYTKYTWTLIKGADGADGTPGKPGSDGKTPYIHFAYANSADGKTDFSVTDYSNKKFIGTLTDYVIPDSTDYTKYTWSRLKGESGVGIANTVVEYQVTDTQDQPSEDSGWTSSIPNLGTGSYLWTRTTFFYTDGTTSRAYTISKQSDNTYTAVLTNDSITLPSDSNGKVTDFSNSTGNFLVYDGTYQVDSTTIKVQLVQAVNVTVTLGGNAYTITAMDSTKDTGYFDLSYTYKGVALTKRVSVSKSKSGANGTTPIIVNLSANAQVFTFDSNNHANPTSQNILFKTTVSGTTATPVYKAIPYDESGNTGAEIVMSNSGTNGKMLQVSQLKDYVSILVTASIGSVSDSTTIVRVKDGSSISPIPDPSNTVSSNTPPTDAKDGDWWNDTSQTPNVLKYRYRDKWVQYELDGYYVKANSISGEAIVTNTLEAQKIKYTNSNGTTTNLQTFDFSGMKTLLTDTKGNTYSNMESAVGSTKVVSSLQKKVNDLGQVNQLINTEFSPDFSGWYDRGLHGKDIKFSLGTPVNGSNVLVKIDGSPTRLQSEPIAVTPGMKVSYSVNKLSSITLWSYLNCSDKDGNIINVPNTSSNEIAGASKQNTGFIKIENIIIPDGVYYVSLGFLIASIIPNGDLFQQPMLVFSDSVGDYAPGQYNNNVRLLKIEESADKFQISIGDSVVKAQDSADSANTKVDNLSTGDRNYILDTANPKTQTSNGKDNQDLYDSAIFYSPIKNWGIANGDYIISFDWTLKTALSSDMQASLFFNNNPWQVQIFTVKSGQTTGHVDLKFKLWGNILTATKDITGLTFRIMSQMASGNTITYSNLFMKSGTIITTWTPAPEDVQSGITSAQTSADSAKTKIDNLSIGGRNYLISGTSILGWLGDNSVISHNGAQGVVYDYIPTIAKDVWSYSVWSDKQYTVTSDGKYLRYALYDSNKQQIMRKAVGLNMSTDTVKGQIVVDNNSSVAYIRVSIDWVANGNGHAKLEKGNIATDWSPAPEDVETGISSAQGSADSAKNKIDSLSVGGRNLLIGTSVSHMGVGNNSTNSNFNAQGAVWNLAGGKKVSDLYNQYGANGYLTISFDWVASGSTISGTFNPQWTNTPWGGLSKSSISPSSSNLSGHFESSVALSQSGYSTGPATGVMFRQDNLQGNITISNLKLESGNQATDWTPAPEDVYSQVLSTNLVVNSEFDNSTGSYTGWHLDNPWGTTVTTQISKNGNKGTADSGAFLYPNPSQMMVHDYSSSVSWIYSDPIPVGANQPLSGSITNANPSGATTNVGLALYVTAYDSSHNKISNPYATNLMTVHGQWVVNSFNNCLTPANTAYVSLSLGWNNGKGYFGQPMLQANTAYTGYVPGTPNSNMAIANAQSSADTATQNAKSAQTSADTANQNLANASKSGIRYIRLRSEGNNDNASTHFSEIKVFNSSGTNVVKGKPALLVNGATNTQSASNATDESYSTYIDLGDMRNSEKYVMFDMGSLRYDVNSVQISTYSSTRTYYGVVAQTSSDGISWSTIYRGNITPNQLIGGVASTTISFGMDTSTVLKLTADNYTLGIDANGNLISGITGNTQQVTLKGNVIHLDGNTVAGPDFFSLWNGKYGSTTIDSTGMEVRTGLSKTKFTNGNMQFITDLGENIGYIGRQVDSVHNNLDYLTFGLNGWHTTYPGDSHYEGGTEDFYGGDGILFGISNADGGYAPLLQWNSGLAASYKSSISGWLFTQPIVGGIDIYGDDYASNKTVSMRFQNVKMSNGFTYPIMTSQQAAGSTGIVIGSGSTYMLGGNSFVWSVAGNGYAYYNTQKRGSSGSSLLMASDGAIIAQTSATKYKSDIEYEPSTSYGDKLLTIDPATWSDKNEKEQIQKYKDTGQEPEYSMNKDGARYYGLIAEDMVKAGLEDLIVRNTENGSVEGIQYEKIGIALIPLLREQRNQINELRVEIERLKEKNNE